MKLSPEIREFLEHGGTCLLVENGEPIGVISSFHEYLRLTRDARSRIGDNGERPAKEEINRDIEFLLAHEPGDVAVPYGPSETVS